MYKIDFSICYLLKCFSCFSPACPHLPTTPAPDHGFHYAYGTGGQTSPPVGASYSSGYNLYPNVHSQEYEDHDNFGYHGNNTSTESTAPLAPKPPPSASSMLGLGNR